MKIEKISETQIKFIITKKELRERNIKAAELNVASEKTAAFFREIMEKAYLEHNFVADNMPIIIEAMSTNKNGSEIMVIVTKIEDPLEVAARLNILPKLREIERAILQTAFYNTMKEISYKSNEPLIYCFKDIDDISLACLKINGLYNGNSALYKESNKYYLVLESKGYNDGNNIDMLDSILSEFSHRQRGNELSKYHFREHGQVLIGGSAVSKMAGILQQ